MEPPAGRSHAVSLWRDLREVLPRWLVCVGSGAATILVLLAVLELAARGPELPLAPRFWRELWWTWTCTGACSSLPSSLSTLD